jgi:hypothetical protein
MCIAGGWQRCVAAASSSSGLGQRGVSRPAPRVNDLEPLGGRRLRRRRSGCAALRRGSRLLLLLLLLLLWL